MNTRLIKLCFLPCFLTCLFSYGQSESEQILNHSVSVTSLDLRSKELVGSPYVNDDFFPAKIKGIETAYPMRYNAYEDEMEFEKEGKFYNFNKVLNQEVVFLATNKKYKLFFDTENNDNSIGYFVVLFQGNKIDLLNKEKIKFFEAVKPKTGYDKYKPPTLKRVNDKFYIGYKNGTTTELPRKKQDVLKLFSEKSNDIQNYAKKNRLSFKDKEDLIQLFKYYNTLN
ncbi:hypothetical protein ACFQZW_06870 [Lutibacter aestuarii]|uniref:Uncharacterized protein n=1 Tax=Lutibacter aestuarii TaxID=861111 RepID=A0ABW2Z4T2_9FLAO